MVNILEVASNWLIFTLDCNVEGHFNVCVCGVFIVDVSDERVVGLERCGARFRAEGLEQGGVARQVIAPVPGKTALAFAPQSQGELADQALSTKWRHVGQLARPQGDQSWKITRAIIGRSALIGFRRCVRRHGWSMGKGVASECLILSRRRAMPICRPCRKFWPQRRRAVACCVHLMH